MTRTLPGAREVFDTLAATWPPAALHDAPDWRVAEGQGGGKRVSAATPLRPDANPAMMEAAQRRLRQTPLAMIRPTDAALDAVLDARGYRLIDPTVAMIAPIEALAQEPPRTTAYEVAWPPLEIQHEIWAAGGIGPARMAVMNRAKGPHIAFLGRIQDQPAATAFVAVHGTLAMVHALEVLLAKRRLGLARHLMGAAALWARDRGATALAILVTRANAPAIALYESLGMIETTGYHYRIRDEVPAR